MHEHRDFSYRVVRHKQLSGTSTQQDWSVARRSFYVSINLLLSLPYLIILQQPRWLLLLNQHDVRYCLLLRAAPSELRRIRTAASAVQPST